MTAPTVYPRTLTHLRAELISRLGYSAQTLTTAQKNTLTSFLQDAQEQLYWELDNPRMRRVNAELSTCEVASTDISFDGYTVTTAGAVDTSVFGSSGKLWIAGSTSNDGLYTITASGATTVTVAEALTTELAGDSVTLAKVGYAWPTEIDPRRLYRSDSGYGVYTKIDSYTWVPLLPGINVAHDSMDEAGHTGQPQRFDVGEFLEVWPVPDDTYPIRIEGYRALDYFQADLTAWTSAATHAVGDIVIPTGAKTWPTPAAEKDGYLALCNAYTTASGTTEPTWPLRQGATVADGGTHWTLYRNRATVDPQAVLLLALAIAKAHFRQADAEQALAVARAHINRLKGAAHTGKRYVRGCAAPDADVPPKPQMV